MLILVLTAHSALGGLPAACSLPMSPTSALPLRSLWDTNWVFPTNTSLMQKGWFWCPRVTLCKLSRWDDTKRRPLHIFLEARDAPAHVAVMPLKSGEQRPCVPAQDLLPQLHFKHKRNLRNLGFLHKHDPLIAIK